MPMRCTASTYNPAIQESARGRVVVQSQGQGQIQTPPELSPASSELSQTAVLLPDTPHLSPSNPLSLASSRTMDDQDIRPHPDAVQVEAEAATKLPPAAAASTHAAPQPEHQKTTEGGSIQPEPAQEEVVSLLCLVWEVHGGLARGRLAGRELVPLLETAERAVWELPSRLLLASRLPILPSTA